MPAEPGTAPLTGWGRTAPSVARVVRPRSVGQVEALVAAAGGRGLAARGHGRSYGAAAQNGGGDVLDMTSLARIRSLDPAAGTVTLDAGLDLDRLLRFLVPLGWFVPVTPGTRVVTVGGALAADVHGKNHHHDGGFADHVESFELMTPAFGPILVGEANPDVFGATAGGMGLTGVIAGATIRLLRIESSWIPDGH